jgi:hypothetical protein
MFAATLAVTGTCGIAAVPGHGQATSAGAGLRCAAMDALCLRGAMVNADRWLQVWKRVRDADVRHAGHIALWCTGP